ncbi:hypothetical protein D0544_02040 [Aestuariirhabdus litorea]|uniref:Uncharacterized protein n=2 Tax=Aestuariirhabdus litorea TaxID=2528527 RepID=A0A3P3VNC2_9GAMM|nr:hypothetical protein D0544_02040 [Aestuariirhabdus litorea]
MIPISHFNPYTLAPGTPNSPLFPQAGLSYEQSNALLDQLGDRLNEARDTREARKEAERTTLLGISHANLRQDQVDTYIRLMSEGEVRDRHTLVDYAYLRHKGITELTINVSPAEQETGLRPEPRGAQVEHYQSPEPASAPGGLVDLRA